MDDNINNNISDIEGKQVPKNQNFKKFLAFVKETTSSTENNLYLLSMGLMKSILYGFLLWMPTLLVREGLGDHKATILIFFNLGTLVGSFVLGYFYEDLKIGKEGCLNAVKKNIKTYTLFYACFGVIISLVFFYLIKPYVVVYFILSTICGAFLGGCFNMLASN